MRWVYLFFAIVFEVAGLTFLKLSDGFTKTIPVGIMIMSYIISFTMLSFAIKKIDVGIAYAIWSGLGTAMIVAIGMVYFHEHLTWLKLFFIILILIGAIGLNLIDESH